MDEVLVHCLGVALSRAARPAQRARRRSWDAFPADKSYAGGVGMALCERPGVWPTWIRRGAAFALELLSADRVPEPGVHL